MGQRTPFDELERLFERVNRSFAGSPSDLSDLGSGGVGGADAPIDVVERDEAVIVTVELPGFEPGDVALRVADRTLFVDAEHDEDASVEEADFVRRERSHRSVSRRIPLPATPEVDAAEATMENGVLTATIPTASAGSAGESIDIE